MNSLVLRSNHFASQHCISPPQNYIKKYGFIIAIILTSSMLIVGAARLDGCFPSALSDVNQIDGIITMAASGAGIILLLITNSRKQAVPLQSSSKSDSSSYKLYKKHKIDPIFDAIRTIPKELISIIVEYADERYGPIWWENKKIRILDIIKQPPDIVFDKKNSALIYIPGKIEFEGQKFDLTFSTFVSKIEPSLDALKRIPYKTSYLESHYPGGWILMGRKAIISIQEQFELEKNKTKNYSNEINKILDKLTKENYSMPNRLEAVVPYVMFCDANEQFYQEDSIGCLEKIDNEFFCFRLNCKKSALWFSTIRISPFEYFGPLRYLAEFLGMSMAHIGLFIREPPTSRVPALLNYNPVCLRRFF